MEDGVLVPWKKNRPEDMKTGRKMVLADRGGLYLIRSRVFMRGVRVGLLQPLPEHHSHEEYKPGDGELHLSLTLYRR